MTDRKDLIGYNRTVRLTWLDCTAEMVAAKCSEKDIVDALRNVLKAELSVGSEAKRGSREKTITILLKTWSRVPPSLKDFQDRGISLWAKSTGGNRLALHWGMTLAAYPFFGAVGEIVGRLLRLQGQVVASQVQRRIKEVFGQRETAARSARYVLRAFVDWGVLREGEYAGVYTQGKIFTVSDPRILVWIVEAAMRTNRNGYLALKAIRESPVLFPFSLRDITPGLLAESGVIEIVHHGMDDDLLVFSRRPEGEFSPRKSQKT